MPSCGDGRRCQKPVMRPCYTAPCNFLGAVLTACTVTSHGMGGLERDANPALMRPSPHTAEHIANAILLHGHIYKLDLQQSLWSVAWPLYAVQE